MVDNTTDLDHLDIKRDPLPLEHQLTIMRYERNLYASLAGPVLLAAGWDWHEAPHVAVQRLLDELEEYRRCPTK